MEEDEEEKMKEIGRKKKERGKKKRRIRGEEGYNRREGEKDG